MSLFRLVVFISSFFISSPFFTFLVRLWWVLCFDVFPFLPSLVLLSSVLQADFHLEAKGKDDIENGERQWRTAR